MKHDSGWGEPVSLDAYRRTRERTQLREARPSTSAMITELVQLQIARAMAEHEQLHHRPACRRVSIRKQS